MNIEDVRAFVAAVDTGSVGKAALKLNLTQPAISRRIQRLEQDLGISLLDRDSKPARPTRAGDAAYKRCLGLLRASEILQQENCGAADLGPLRLGLSYALADSILAPAVEAVRAACPDIQLRISAERSPVLRKQLSDGLLDAAIVAALPDRPLEGPRAVLLGIESVVVVAPSTLKIKSRRIADLADLPWIINPDGCGFRTQLDQAFTACGRVLKVTAEIWGTAPQLSLIARGAGVGLVPERLLPDSPHRAALKTLPMEDFEAAVAICLVAGPDSIFDRPIEVLRETVSGLLTPAAQRRGKTARRA